MKLLSNKLRQIAAPCQCCTKCPAQTQPGRGIKWWGEYWEDFVLTQRSHILHRQFMCYVLPPLWYFLRNSLFCKSDHKSSLKGKAVVTAGRGVGRDRLVTHLWQASKLQQQVVHRLKWELRKSIRQFLYTGDFGRSFFFWSNSLIFIEGGKTGLNSHHPDCPPSPDEFVPITAAGCKHTHLRWDGGTDLAENSFPHPFSLGYFPSGSVLLISSSSS